MHPGWSKEEDKGRETRSFEQVGVVRRKGTTTGNRQGRRLELCNLFLLSFLVRSGET